MKKYLLLIFTLCFFVVSVYSVQHIKKELTNTTNFCSLEQKIESKLNQNIEEDISKKNKLNEIKRILIKYKIPESAISLDYKYNSVQVKAKHPFYVYDSETVQNIFNISGYDNDNNQILYICEVITNYKN